jgi:ubiquitin-protein ligase
MSMKRVMADVSELQKPIYQELRIHYSPNVQNVLEGNACVFGPFDTPYEDCPMMYRFQIPKDFPFEPPKVTFLTNDGETRIHPNMYCEGKVCLSILGTWQGPKWASTMRLSTVLVTLQSLMDTEPLRHEPNYEKGRDELVNAYTNIIESRCIRYSLVLIEKLLKGYSLPDYVQVFEEILRANIPERLERFRVRLEKLVETKEQNYINLPYGMQGKTDYARLLEFVVKLKDLANSTQQ